MRFLHLLLVFILKGSASYKGDVPLQENWFFLMKKKQNIISKIDIDKEINSDEILLIIAVVINWKIMLVFDKVD